MIRAIRNEGRAESHWPDKLVVEVETEFQGSSNPPENLEKEWKHSFVVASLPSRQRRVKVSLAWHSHGNDSHLFGFPSRRDTIINMNVNVKTTFGDFYSINIVGEIATEKEQEIVDEGTKSLMYRGSGTKLDVILAKSMGETRTLKNGEIRPEQGFKRGRSGGMKYNAELNPALQKAVEQYFATFGEFTVEVKEYVAKTSDVKVSELKSQLSDMDKELQELRAFKAAMAAKAAE